MQQFVQWLRQPYPFEKNWLKALRSGLWAGAFVMLFLFFFKPFGTTIPAGAEWHYLRICAFFGLVTLTVILFVNAVCVVLPRVFNEEKWIVWKEILFNLFFVGCIGLGNLLLAHFLWKTPLNAKTFWTWQGLTFAVGIFPTLFGAFLGQMKMNRKYAAEAARLAPLVHQKMVSSHQTVTLAGDNQNEILRLDTAQIAYLSAADNYVQVFFFENEILKSRMLRATMKKMEDALADHAQIFRCHRTYIVNLEKVRHVSGNAQGYRLHLEGAEATVPVSRNLNEVVQEKLMNVDKG